MVADNDQDDDDDDHDDGETARALRNDTPPRCSPSELSIFVTTCGTALRESCIYEDVNCAILWIFLVNRGLDFNPSRCATLTLRRLIA